jgi:hypothetical protein
LADSTDKRLSVLSATWATRQGDLRRIGRKT